jgi:hypothetical protein
MKVRGNSAGGEHFICPRRFPKISNGVRLAAGFGVSLVLIAEIADGLQQPASPPRQTILLPEANHLPDVNDQMKLHQQNAKKQNFDIANAERKRELDDESAKLLILARDLKEQTDRMGSAPLTSKALREAEIIEVLARDVKEKMKLTMGGS